MSRVTTGEKRSTKACIRTLQLRLTILTMCFVACSEAPETVVPELPGESTGESSAAQIPAGSAFPDWPLATPGDSDVVFRSESLSAGDHVIEFADPSGLVSGEALLSSGTCSVLLSKDHALVAVGPVGYWFAHATAYIELKAIDGQWSPLRIGLWQYSDLGGGGWGTDLGGHVTIDGSSDQASVQCDLVLHNASKRGIQARFAIELGEGSELLEEFLESDPHGQAMKLSQGSQAPKDR